ncbi:RING zinc finger-containing protein [Tieghemostelium lacteum]|uniref:RING zinc finger-containing protein n=1 Tax=Tieghemostelium lacteum TaxID=361077 RepID=A0A151ZRZ8_TIELA|nr:RING zinc finger-containing protein [Tieghemostelium lacteum]|eukprot:KYQ96708.1 RING zinc finger-containing protein [Tieghemostelium lacteum]
MFNPSEFLIEHPHIFDAFSGYRGDGSSKLTKPRSREQLEQIFLKWLGELGSVSVVGFEYLEEFETILQIFNEWLDSNSPGYDKEYFIQQFLSSFVFRDYMLFAQYFNWVLDCPVPQQMEDSDTKKQSDKDIKLEVRDSMQGSGANIVKANSIFSFYPKSLSIDYYKGILVRNGIVYHGLNSSNFLIRKAAAQSLSKVFDRQNDFIPFKDELTPLSKITNIIYEANISKYPLDNGYSLVEKIINNIIPEDSNDDDRTSGLQKSDFIRLRRFLSSHMDKNYSVTYKVNLNEKYVYSLIHSVVSEGLEKQQSFEISRILSFICLSTFPNLQYQEIMNLQSAYLQLLPYIFKYNQFTKYKLSTYLAPYHQTKSGSRNLRYYKEYFGNEWVAHHSFQLFLKWTNVKNPRLRLNSVGTLLSLGVDSDVIREHRVDIMKRLVTNFQSKHFELHKQTCDCICQMAGKHPDILPIHAQALLDIIRDKQVLNVPKAQDTANASYYDLFKLLCKQTPNIIISKFQELFDYCSDPRLNDMLVELGDNFKKLPKFSSYYKSLLTKFSGQSTNMRDKQNSFILLESISLFNTDPKQLEALTATILPMLIGYMTYHTDIQVERALMIYYQHTRSDKTFRFFERSCSYFINASIENPTIFSTNVLPFITKAGEAHYLQHLLISKYKQMNRSPSLMTITNLQKILIQCLDSNSPLIGEPFITKILETIIQYINSSSVNHYFNHMDEYRLSFELLLQMNKFINIDSLVKSSLLSLPTAFKNCMRKVDDRDLRSLAYPTAKLLTSLLDFSPFYLNFLQSFLYILMDTNIMEIDTKSKDQKKKENSQNPILINSSDEEYPKPKKRVNWVDDEGYEIPYLKYSDDDDDDDGSSSDSSDIYSDSSDEYVFGYHSHLGTIIHPSDSYGNRQLHTHYKSMSALEQTKQRNGLVLRFIFILQEVLFNSTTDKYKNDPDEHSNVFELLLQKLIPLMHCISFPLVKQLMLSFLHVKKVEVLKRAEKGLIGQFKVLGNNQKRSLLYFIKSNNIENCKFMFDEEKTGYHYEDVEEANMGTLNPYMQDLIIQKILLNIFVDRSSGGTSTLIPYAMVSKRFFNVCRKLFKTLPLELDIRDQIDTSEDSLLYQGPYQLKYSQLQFINYKNVQKVFYQLGSLYFDAPKYFTIKNEMSNLTNLVVTTNRKKWSVPDNNLQLLYTNLLNIVEHCHTLERFKMDLRDNVQKKLPPTFQEFFDTLLKNNTQLRVIKLHSACAQISYETFQPDFVATIDKIIAYCNNRETPCQFILNECLFGFGDLSLPKPSSSKLPKNREFNQDFSAFLESEDSEGEEYMNYLASDSDDSNLADSDESDDELRLLSVTRRAEKSKEPLDPQTDQYSLYLKKCHSFELLMKQHYHLTSHILHAGVIFANLRKLIISQLETHMLLTLYPESKKNIQTMIATSILHLETLVLNVSAPQDFILLLDANCIAKNTSLQKVKIVVGGKKEMISLQIRETKRPTEITTEYIQACQGLFHLFNLNKSIRNLHIQNSDQSLLPEEKWDSIQTGNFHFLDPKTLLRLRRIDPNAQEKEEEEEEEEEEDKNDKKDVVKLSDKQVKEFAQELNRNIGRHAGKLEMSNIYTIFKDKYQKEQIDLYLQQQFIKSKFYIGGDGCIRLLSKK